MNTTYELAQHSGSGADTLELFRRAYGARFDEAIATRLLDRSDARYTLVSGLGEVAAVAAIGDDKRIMMQSPLASDKPTRRYITGILFSELRDTAVAEWLTIGERYIGLQALIGRVGMTRVNGIDEIIRRLAPVNQDGRVDTAIDDSGELVVVSHGEGIQNPGYRQQVWQWGMDNSLSETERI